MEDTAPSEQAPFVAYRPISIQKENEHGFS